MPYHLNHYHPPAHTGLDICYQDDELLVCNKPAGLLSVPGRGENKQDSLSLRVQQEYPQALITHRLDMPTSGLLIVALNPAMQREIGLLFQARKIHKKYIAVVDGKPQAPQGEINQPLICDWPNRPLQKIDKDLGKPSLTLYRLIEYDEKHNTSRLELIPKTGRSHQLRVHMQFTGHSILGDVFYASKDIAEKSDRLLLHASALELTHPLTQQTISIHCPPPF